VDDEHLFAALAIWERAEASARFIFGSALGDPIADEILRGIRSAHQLGMNRTEISRLFNRHQSAERIGAALDLIEGAALLAAKGAPGARQKKSG
jgi:hypothetical protein